MQQFTLFILFIMVLFKPTIQLAQQDTIIQAQLADDQGQAIAYANICLLYTSPSPRDATLSRMPSSA